MTTGQTEAMGAATIEPPGYAGRRSVPEMHWKGMAQRFWLPWGRMKVALGRAEPSSWSRGTQSAGSTDGSWVYTGRNLEPKQKLRESCSLYHATGTRTRNRTKRMSGARWAVFFTHIPLALLLAGIWIGSAGCQSGAPGQTERADSYRLTYSTYLGGSDFEQARDVAIDDRGYVYATGGTRSRDFLATYTFKTPGEKEAPAVHDLDVFVTKFDPAGAVVWSTVVGGPNYDRAYAIEVDSQGFVYVGGRGGNGFPVTKGAFQKAFAGGGEAGFYSNQDGFVFKLKPDGSDLVWASYFGGTDQGIVRDVDIDASGNVYVGAGFHPGGSYPTSVRGAFQKGFRPDPLGGNDTVVAKIEADGTEVLWATYLGGSSDDSPAPSVRVDASRYVYVAGTTHSPDFSMTQGAYDTSYNGEVDGYVAKLSPDGENLVFATYFGGSRNDSPGGTHGLTLDSEGNPYVAGDTTSTDMPTTPGAFQTAYHGGSTGKWQQDRDFFVMKLSADGSRLVGSTYVGGSSGDGPPEGVVVDRFGNVYFTGGSYSSDFPTTLGAFQKTNVAAAGKPNGVLVKLSADFSTLRYSTYFGGTGGGSLRAVAINANGDIAAGGLVEENWPLRNAHQSKYAGNWDTAIVKFVRTAIATTIP